MHNERVIAERILRHAHDYLYLLYIEQGIASTSHGYVRVYDKPSYIIEPWKSAFMILKDAYDAQ